MITVTVIGRSGDPQAMMLAERTRRAVARTASPSLSFSFVEVGARDRVNGVSELPALAIGGEVIAQGRKPKMQEIQQALERTLESAYPDDLEVHSSQTAPLCGGCGRGCTLDAPGCRVGRRRAQAQGIKPRR